MTVLSVISNVKRATSPVRLVRTVALGDWALADSDMGSVWVLKPGATAFVPLVQATWNKDPEDKLPGAVAYINAASRAYLPSLAEATAVDGTPVVVAELKLGVKEVELAHKAGKPGGLPFEKCAWGMYLVGFNKATGAVLWHGRYPIHKGNAQVVSDLPSLGVMLVASTGLAWRIEAGTGNITWKGRVPMGESGEKNKARFNGQRLLTGFVGYTKCPCAVARNGMDERAIQVGSKPPLNGIGDDMTYCDIISAWMQPKGIWFCLVHDGDLRFNFVGPRVKTSKYGNDPAYAGLASKEDRHAPSLFQIPGNRKTVGVAFTHKGEVFVQSLTEPKGRRSIGPGSWPVATLESDGYTHVHYFKGNDLYEATVSCS
jgi:hypothetical protein